MDQEVGGSSPPSCTSKINSLYLVAAFDSVNPFCFRTGFVRCQPTMLPDGDTARPAIFAKLCDVDLGAAWKGGDAESGERIVPKENAILADFGMGPTAAARQRRYEAADRRPWVAIQGPEIDRRRRAACWTAYQRNECRALGARAPGVFEDLCLRRSWCQSAPAGGLREPLGEG
jgi:hypothetical protein